MDNLKHVLELLSQREQQLSQAAQEELDGLLKSTPADQQLDVLRVQYVDRVTQLQGQINNLQSNLQFAKRRPELIQLANFVCGASIAAVVTYITLSGSFLAKSCFF